MKIDIDLEQKVAQMIEELNFPICLIMKTLRLPEDEVKYYYSMYLKHKEELFEK